MLSGLVGALDEAEDRPLVHALPALLGLPADLVVQTVLDARLVTEVEVQPVDLQLPKLERLIDLRHLFLFQLFQLCKTMTRSH